MPCIKIERWCCERCDAYEDSIEDGEGSCRFDAPEGWAFIDDTELFEGPLCPKCISSFRRWMTEGKKGSQ